MSLNNLYIAHIRQPEIDRASKIHRKGLYLYYFHITRFYIPSTLCEHLEEVTSSLADYKFLFSWMINLCWRFVLWWFEFTQAFHYLLMLSWGCWGYWMSFADKSAISFSTTLYAYHSPWHGRKILWYFSLALFPAYRWPYLYLISFLGYFEPITYSPQNSRRNFIFTNFSLGWPILCHARAIYIIYPKISALFWKMPLISVVQRHRWGCRLL
jgi:hypothetical protein